MIAAPETSAECPDRCRHAPAADATRPRILDAALELFSTRSFEGASTREIADLTGTEVDSYFQDTDIGYALAAVHARRLLLAQPLALAELRRRWTSFSTPQTHRRVLHDELNSILNGERRRVLPPR